MSPIRRFEGKTPYIAPDAYVDPTAVVIGDVELGPRASLWPGAVVRGDIHAIRIGAETNIQDGSVLHVTHDSRFNPGGHPLRIGDGVTVGHRVTLHGCTIGDRCLIGMGAIVMDGATLEEETILGAGSLVPPGKYLTGRHLWVGSPARQVRPLTDQEREQLRYAAAHYVALARRHGKS